MIAIFYSCSLFPPLSSQAGPPLFDPNAPVVAEHITEAVVARVMGSLTHVAQPPQCGELEHAVERGALAARIALFFAPAMPPVWISREQQR